jgi:hypothetical protein
MERPAAGATNPLCGSIFGFCERDAQQAMSAFVHQVNQAAICK